MEFYRTAAENFLDILTPEQRDELRIPLVEEFKLASRRDWIHYSYALKNSQRRLLSQHGIPLHPNGCLPHPHPASKTIENFLLHGVLSHLVKEKITLNNERITLFSMKQRKFDAFRASNAIFDDLNCDLFNRLYHTNDVTRYGSAWPTQCKGENYNRFFNVHRRKFEDRVVVIHDEIHHWGVSDLVSFLDVAKPKTVFATAVYPVEVMFGSHTSLNPCLYEFDIKGDILLYYPDGKTDAKYEQKRTFDILRMGVVHANKTYCISVAKTIGSHHLIVIERGNLAVERFRVFNDFTHYNPLINGEMLSRVRNLRIDRVKLTKLIIYMMSLKKPDVESSMAKLRQLSDDIDPCEIMLAKEIGSILVKKNLEFGHRFFEAFHEWLSSGFIKESLLINAGVINGADLLLKAFKKEFQHKFVFDLEERAIIVDEYVRMDCNNIVEVFDSAWMGSNLSDILDRSPMKYELFGFELNYSILDLKFYMLLNAEGSNDTIRDILTRKGRKCAERHVIVISRSKKWRLGWKENEEGGRSASEASFDSAEFEREILELEKREEFDISTVFKSEEVEVMEKISKEGWNGKNVCLISAVADSVKMDPINLLTFLFASDPVYWGSWLLRSEGSDELSVSKLADYLKRAIVIVEGEIEQLFGVEGDSEPIVLDKRGDHVVLRLKQEGMFNFSRPSMDVRLAFDNEITRLPYHSSFDYEVSYERTKILSNEFHCGREGVLFGEIKDKKMLDIKKHSDFNQRIHVISGLPGSGKSKFIEGFAKRLKSKKIIVICPRKKIKEIWEKSVDNVVTYEVALTKRMDSYDIFILDEYTLYPPGYLDIVIGSNEGRDVRYLLIGDPLQAAFHSFESRKLNEISFNILKNLPELNYLFLSHRMGGWANSIWPFECIGHSDEWKFNHVVFQSIASLFGVIKDEAEFPEAFICASFDDKVLVPKNCGVPVMTFGESQGTTFGKVGIIVTGNFKKVSNNHWFVALTRSRKGNCFINYTDVAFDVVLKRNPDTLISRYYNKRISEDFLNGFVIESGVRKMNRVGNVNMKRSDVEIKLSGDPWLKPYMFIGKCPEAQIMRMQKAFLLDPEFKTHLPLCEEKIDFASMFEALKAKEFREFRKPYDMSSQFIDQQSRELECGAGQPFLFESIYPRHRNSDEMTFWAAVKKRLRFSTPEIEREKYEKNFKFGRLIFDNFMKYVPMEKSFDERLMSKVQDDFEITKLKKNAGTIESHAMRSNRDWDELNVFIFIKTQLCTKLEKRFCDAKAGQTLACFSHLVLCHFSKWCRYIDAKLDKCLHDLRRAGKHDFYVHTRKNFDELNEWVRRQKFNGVCTESDYEAFDASQDSIILAFEVCMMNHFGFPVEIVEAYKHIKFNLKSKLGRFAVMRFTGEFCTFLFNTLANMAFTFLRYDMNKVKSICFAGDDMCANGNLREIDGFEEVLGRMSLKAKVCRTKCPTFCGWKLTKYGIVKDSRLIWERFMVAKERNNMRECLESYTLEACYAYELGDRLFDVLDEEQLRYYYLINRLIVKNLNSLPASIASIYSKINYLLDGSDKGEQVHEGICELWESDRSDSQWLNLP
ncbi:ORF1 [Teosinte-associated betaflexivirus]|nr:ORF1 [Teosinte-associated betaflexivirus]